MIPIYRLALGLTLTLSGLMNAGAAELSADKTSATACRDTGSYPLPQIPWMGKFGYKVSVTVKDGRPEDVDIETVRGPDKTSNRTITESLREHVKKNYVCEGVEQKSVFYLILNFPHEVPALAAKRLALRAALPALHAAATASAAAAAASDIPAETLVPVRAAMVCTAMGKPPVPATNAVGTLSLHVIVDVNDGKIGLVDTKLKQGSNDPSLNRKFIELVSSTVRETYQCPGNHIFEQEFTFTIS